MVTLKEKAAKKKAMKNNNQDFSVEIPLRALPNPKHSTAVVLTKKNME